MGCSIRFPYSALPSALFLDQDPIGTCVTTLTGHRDLVTNIDFQKVPISVSGSGGLFMDAITSVSDDGSVKLFLLDVASFA